MSQAICVRCGGEVDGTAYVDTRCTDRARAQLAEIADMVGAARDIATGQARHSGSGGGSGKPGSRLPLDLAATAKLDGVTAALGSWLRLVVAERGTDTADVSHWGDPIEGIAVKLGNHLEWLRHQRFADEFLTDVEAAARVVRSVARGPAEMKYLGPCGALVIENYARTEAEGWTDESGTMRTCDGDVYGRAGADKGSCRTCGAQVDQAERQMWLGDVRRDWLFTAKDIADAYQINVKTIRSWHNRGLLAAHGHDGDSVPLHKVGEVLDLAASDAARREEARATRARRLQQRSGGQAA